MTKDFHEQDDEEADPARLAIKRTDAAKKPCEAIKELSVADVEGPSIAAGWATLSKSAARALDFDARLTSSNTVQKAHELLKSTLRDNGSTGGHRVERGGAQHRPSIRATREMQLVSTIRHHRRRSLLELVAMHT